MSSKFRDDVLKASEEALTIVNKFFKGEIHGTDKVKEAMNMVRHGIKVEHMNQLQELGNKSFALRLVKYLPKEIDKEEYIRLTNPQLKQIEFKKKK